jgi:hypothetical protein
MVAHRDTNACYDNVRHVRCQCSSPQFITPLVRNQLTMQVPINVKSPNNISKWQIGFKSMFKGLNEDVLG